MKKLLAILLIVVLCFGLTACGDGEYSLKAEINTYTNAAGTVSIDLIDKWIASESVPEDTLDVTYRNGSINVHIETLAKGQAAGVASDLESYAKYSRKNLEEGVLSTAKFTKEEIAVPEFINNSTEETFIIEDGDNKLNGILVFMESDKCYYTVLIMAVDLAWNVNDEVLKESISTIKEISEIPATEATEEE
jgi:hypothetical protein